MNLDKHPKLSPLDRSVEQGLEQRAEQLTGQLVNRATLLYSESSQSLLAHYREAHGHTTVVECRGKIFRLCDSMGDFEDCSHADHKKIAVIRDMYPYLLQIEPLESEEQGEPAALFRATEILESPIAA